LGASILTRSLVESSLTEGHAPAPVVDALVRMRHQLPVGRAGAQAYAETVGASTQLAARVGTAMGERRVLAPATFELDLPEGVLDCHLREVWQEGLVRWSPGPMRGHHWVRPWIEYLALAACGDRARAGFDGTVALLQVAPGANGVEEILLRDIDVDTARAQLSILVRGYVEGQRVPLPFFPKSAWLFVSALAEARPDAETRAWNAARAAYTGEANRRGEREDAWIALAFRDRDPFSDAMLAGQFEHAAIGMFARLAGIIHGAAL